MRALAILFVGAFASSAYAKDLPEIKSHAAIVIDADTGAEIYGKDADEVVPIASTTKIFVAMAIRKKGFDLDGWTDITKTDAKYAKGGARTRLDVGQTFKNKDLLRAMLIASDNRAPTALARAAGLDPDQLVDAMNDVAKQLHLKRTKFTDPTGLRGNVSTAREMALALHAALEDDVLKGVMAETEVDVVSKDGYAKITYKSTNIPLRAHKWDVIGGKTGYTEKAGYCFVTEARFDGRNVVTAFYGAEGKLTRFGDFNRVAEWIDRGSPGGKLHPIKKRHDKSEDTAVDLETHGRVAKQTETASE